MEEDVVMSGYRILLISQDRWLVDRLRDVLDSAGFEAEIALSGAVGARVAVERRVDLLLADEAVEDFHNVRKIKDPAAPTYRLPIIVIGADGKPTADDVRTLIPFAVVARNFDADDLVGKINQVMQYGEKLGAKLGRKVVA